MSLSPFSSFLSYSYVGKLSVTLGGIIMLKSAFCRSQICGESNTFCAFCVRLPLTHHLSPNNTNTSAAAIAAAAATAAAPPLSCRRPPKLSRCRHRRSLHAAATALPPSRCAPPSRFALPPPPPRPRQANHGVSHLHLPKIREELIIW